MGKPYSTERSETNNQVINRQYDGSGNHKCTEVWEKDSAGCTTKEGYSRVVDGERYNYYGSHTGSAGRKK